MSIQAIEPQMCPDCGHRTSGVVGGLCTAFVPGRTAGVLAEYCHCDCYQVITGRSMREDIRDAFRQLVHKEETEDG